MVFKKIHLITNEFRLIKSVDTFEHIKNNFSSKEINYVNFGHYPNPPEDQSLRIKMEFFNDKTEQKALKLVKKLIGNGYIIDVQPDEWVEKKPNNIVKEAITFSSECAVTISKLKEFKDISQSNPLPPQFCLCFFNEIFKEIGINLGLNQKRIVRLIKNHNLENLIFKPVKLLKSKCESKKSKFSNPDFFERFIHMLDNNLLIFPEIEKPVLCGNFLRIHRLSSETPMETIKRFCKQLK